MSVISENSVIKVYGAEWCSYCKRVKRLLETYNLQFIDQDAFETLQTIKFMQRENHQTIPQVYIDDVNIGGYQETREYLEKHLTM